MGTSKDKPVLVEKAPRCKVWEADSMTGELSNESYHLTDDHLFPTEITPGIRYEFDSDNFLTESQLKNLLSISKGSPDFLRSALFEVFKDRVTGMDNEVFEHLKTLKD